LDWVKRVDARLEMARDSGGNDKRIKACRKVKEGVNKS